MTIKTECEKETRAYFDVAQNMVRAQEHIMTSIVFAPERGTGRAVHIKGILDNIIREVSRAEPIVKEDRDAYVEALEAVKNRVPAERVSSRDIDVINSRVGDIIDQRVLLDMLDRFAKCSYRP